MAEIEELEPNLISEAAPKHVKVERTDKTEQKEKRKKKKKKHQIVSDVLTAENLATQIIGIHMMAALFLQMPQAQIAEEPAHLMAEALYEIIKEYDMAWLVRLAPWFSFAFITITVEAPIIIAIRTEWLRRKAAQVEQTESDVPPPRKRKPPKIVNVGPEVQ